MMSKTIIIHSHHQIVLVPSTAYKVCQFFHNKERGNTKAMRAKWWSSERLLQVP